jgi:hypothetical protein
MDTDQKPKPPTFIPELSDTRFELTAEEQAHLNDLLLWQELSQKSVFHL